MFLQMFNRIITPPRPFVNRFTEKTKIFLEKNAEKRKSRASLSRGKGRAALSACIKSPERVSRRPGLVCSYAR